VSRLTVSPSPADLLDVTLEILGHVVMDDAADVRFVQPHAESHRGHHHAESAAHEALLDAAAFGGGEAGVVGVRDPLGRAVGALFPWKIKQKRV